jgi:hypothetical protein
MLKYILLFFLFSNSLFGYLTEARPQDSANKHFFYQPISYGSEALIHPVRLILNGGFGILQMDNRGNNVTDIQFKTGLKNLTWNLSHPVSAIKQEGFSHFVETQIIPLSFDDREAYYWPNYTLHLIGGGMSYRMMESWFYYHNYPHPKIFSLLTLTAYHFLNEVVESNDYVGYDPDPIADMYIFNPLGILLFSSNTVSRFFSQTLNMADWSYQISFNPAMKSVENLGQNFVMKLWLNKSQSLGLLYHFGTHGELGLSFRQPDGDCFSFGLGLVANKLIDQSNRRDLRELTADLVLTAGLFYDRNNSLMASLIYSKTQDFKVRLNTYPGLFKLYNFSPGLFFSLNQKNLLSVGITVRFLPIGLATSF